MLTSTRLPAGGAVGVHSRIRTCRPLVANFTASLRASQALLIRTLGVPSSSSTNLDVRWFMFTAIVLVFLSLVYRLAVLLLSKHLRDNWHTLENVTDGLSTVRLYLTAE